jgi:hypothetical protein
MLIKLCLAILIALASLLVEPYVFCINGRSCPDTYTCSSDGIFCCLNSDCSTRSNWSLLKSECPNGRNYASDTHLCNEYMNFTISKVSLNYTEHLILTFYSECRSL